MKINETSRISETFTQCVECPIRQRALFKGVPEDRLSWTQHYREKQVSIPAGLQVFQEGDVHDYVYTLFSGWGIIYKTVNSNGKRQILRFLLPGDLIGFQSTKNTLMPYSAKTITGSVLCAFPRAIIDPMLKQNPSLAVRLLEMASGDLALCQNHLVATGRKTARESIAFVLMELYYRVQYQVADSYSKDENRIDFPITQEDLGDAVGLTNIHVNRVIKELVKERLINIHKKMLTILNEKKLCEIAEFSPDMILSPPVI